MRIEFEKFISDNRDSVYKTLRELAIISAPSGHEEKRAEYCLEFLKKCGGNNAYIDCVNNVVLPLNIGMSNEITVLAAHTDIVFDYDVPLIYEEKDGNIYCPGIGDDTVCVVVLLYTAKFFLEKGIFPEKGILIVLNSCEEGMGNLKGVKQLFKDYSGRIKEFVTYDSDFYNIVNECVGSHRYKVEVTTEGGHSFAKFGNANAIAALSGIVGEIYKLEVPHKEGKTTTYNVGIIEGGTSVNTIAQNASMLCEYRSDSKECLEYMKERFNDIFHNAATDKVNVDVTLIGERPCSDVDMAKQEELTGRCKKVCEEIYNASINLQSGSTDCNIPLSLGIPAVCVGVFIGDLSHTREEWIEKESVLKGLLCSLTLFCELGNIK